MDNEASVNQTESDADPISAPTMTATSPKSPRAAGVEPEGHERNGVFGHLVKDDGDIAGLVAYSIYKQNKLDWLTSFEATKSRAPNDAELSSYIIGEGTPRRLATYRHLAEATLAGRGPEVDGSPGQTRLPTRRTGAASPSAFSPPIIGAYVLIAIIFVIGFWLAAHYTLASR